MAAVASPAMGTAFLSAGGEAPLEADPSSRHCLEARARLPQSLLWRLQGCYYEALGEAAFAQDVPSFVSSNAKLAQDYARMIFNFLRDVYNPPQSAASAPPKGPCLLLEIGAGHGRFTYLLLRFLLAFQPFFEALGMPARPFILFFTDFAGPNIEGCRSHPDLKPFVEEGWLDFMVFDANEPPGEEELRSAAARHSCGGAADGEVPTVVICNYVLDTLVQEALRFGGEPPMVHRGLLSIFSSQEEPTYLDPQLGSRLTFAWDWEVAEDLTAAAVRIGEGAAADGPDDQAAADPAPAAEQREQEALRDEGYLAAVYAYLAAGSPMTAVLPVGAFRLVHAIHRLAGERLLLLVGDKGHRDASEFVGWREPHLAVHGSFSFMVNFDALRAFFEHYGGFAVHTPYHDVFQCGAYALGARGRFPSLLSMLAEAQSDFGPASMMLWSRQLAHASDLLLHPHTASPQDAVPPLAKSVMALLRYSGHDPELFWQFQPLLLQQCSLAHLGSRAAKDLAADLAKVYANSFRMPGAADRDLAVAIGECLVRMGKVSQAAEYFQRSLEDRGPNVSVLLQWSCCLQASGRIDEAVQAAEQAHRAEPNSVAAAAQLRNLEMYANSLGTALVGGGRQTIEQSGPLLAQDLRFRVRVVFAFSEEEAKAMAAELERVGQVLYMTGQDVPAEGGLRGLGGQRDCRPEVLWGAEGLQEILKRGDIAVCVVDVHHKMLPGLLPKLWAARKHVLSHSPLAYNLASAQSLVAAYRALPEEKGRPAWHALESARFEDALVLAGDSLARVGQPHCISMVVTAPQRSMCSAASSVPVEEQMAIDVVHGLAAAVRVTKSRLAAVSCQAGGPAASGGAGERRADAALAGHFLLSPQAAAGGGPFTGTFVTCAAGMDPRWELCFHCARGSLVLKREKAAWQMTVTDDRAGAFGRKSLERSLPCVGYRSSHQAFLAQVRASAAGETADVDVSIEHALVDTAILGSLLSSMKSNGASMAFKYAN